MKKVDRLFLRSFLVGFVGLLFLPICEGQHKGFEWVVQPKYEFFDFWRGFDGSGVCYDIPIVFDNGLALCYKDRFTMAVFDMKGKQVTPWFENVLSEQWIDFSQDRIRLYQLKDPTAFKAYLKKEEEKAGELSWQLAIFEGITKDCDQKIDIYLKEGEVKVEKTPLSILDLYALSYHSSFYSEGLAIIHIDGQTGYMNTNKQIVIEPLFDT